MIAVNLAMIVIYSSNGIEDWEPVLPADVPDWIKNDPDMIGKMISGLMCKKRDSEFWFKAVRVVTAEERGREQARLSAYEQRRRRRQDALRTVH